MKSNDLEFLTTIILEKAVNSTKQKSHYTRGNTLKWIIMSSFTICFIAFVSIKVF